VELDREEKEAWGIPFLDMEREGSLGGSCLVGSIQVFLGCPARRRAVLGSYWAMTQRFTQSMLNGLTELYLFQAYHVVNESGDDTDGRRHVGDDNGVRVVKWDRVEILASILDPSRTPAEE
jgi:hypothetical protein